MSVEQIAQLNRRDLLIEQKLQGLSKKSLPSKELEGTPPKNLINSVQGDINLKDLDIEEQLQKISRNAIKDVLGWKPTKVKSDVTNEMIQEYQDEMANSFYDDPISGKRLKYVPLASDLTLEEYNPHQIYNDREIEEIRAEIRQLTAARKAAELLIVEELDRLEEIKSSVEFQEDTRKKGFYSKEFLRENPDLAQLQPEYHYLNYVQRKENEINGYRARIFEIDGELGQLEETIRQNEVAKRENQAQKDRVGKANYEVLKQKSEELNLLNRGQLNLTRQPNETDEEFRQRLIDAGQVEFDETAIEQQAGRRAILKFKDNMKELTRNNILIENIIKSVEPSRLFLYNKFFQVIKRKFQEIYGKATFKDNDYTEVINIFDNIIDKVNLSNAKIQLATTDEPPPYATVIGPPPYEEPEPENYVVDERFASSRPTAPITELPYPPTKEQREQARREQATYERRQRALAEKAEPEKAEYEYPPDLTPMAEARLAEPIPAEAIKPFDIGRNPYDLTKPELIGSFGNEYSARTGKKLKANMKRDEIDKALLESGIIRPKASYSGSKPIESYMGKGLYEKLPKFAQFGKIIINPSALYYKNTLIITTNGRYHLSGYKNIKVSDDFVSIIMKILHGEHPNHKEIQKLDLAEKELYDNVIHLAHLHKKIDHNLTQTRQSMKHRFELLNGEIGAGNTNKALKTELIDLVHRMAYAGMISHHQRYKFIKSL